MVSLRELNLQFTAISDASIKSVLTLRGLRKLDVYCEPGQLSVARLGDLKAMPSLQVLSYNAEEKEENGRALRLALPAVRFGE